MTDVQANIAAFESSKADLESTHMGKWVVFHDTKLVDIYDSFEAAASEAVKAFGRGPYLIRQIGAAPVALPASIMFRQVYA